MKHTYLFGDIQGCFDGLMKLLEHIAPNSEDRLVFLGDVINRGGQSKKVLDFIIDNNHQMILGNHDFHLLACYFGIRKPTKHDTFGDILSSPNVSKYIEYLLSTPVVMHEDSNYFVHAGIPSVLTHNEVLKLSSGISYELSHNPKEFLEAMYEEGHTSYNANSLYYERLRYTVNATMRMRYVTADNQLNFDYKGDVTSAPEGITPWFKNNPHLVKSNIYFGHWSTLTNPNIPHLYPLDGGYIWGGELKALRLGDNKVFSIK